MAGIRTLDLLIQRWRLWPLAARAVKGRHLFLKKPPPYTIARFDRTTLNGNDTTRPQDHASSGKGLEMWKITTTHIFEKHTNRLMKVLKLIEVLDFKRMNRVARCFLVQHTKTGNNV
jgi:hypothetical protein